MSSNEVRLQNLRDFTVQIRRPSDDVAVGTGVAVSTAGQVVTCAHVVKAALGVHPRDADGAEVGVYFPQARGGEEKARRARVAGCFPQHDDDVVLLQLTGNPAPLAPEQIAVLGTAEPSQGNPFRSYGYRSLGQYKAAFAYGLILGCVECPEGLLLQTDPVQLQSQHIAPGMSGAAALDTERNLVVGVVSETWYPGSSLRDRDTAWAVNARVLTFDPFNFSLRDEPLDKRPAPQPRTDVEAARRAVAPGLGVAWNNAPALLEEWVGREDLLQAITRDWASPERQVTGLIGFGGEGKSGLARQWMHMLGNLPNCPTPDGIFWWGFYTRPSVDEFFEAALDYMGGGRIDPRQYPSASAKAHLIAAMLHTGRYLFVLDGLEEMQHQEGDQYGLLRSGDLREFLEYFAAPGHRSFCLITSRAPVLDLMEYTTYIHRDVTRLSAPDGRDLLREVGVQGPDVDLDKVVKDWDGHALTLSLLGAYLVDLHGGDVAYIDEIPPPTAEGEEKEARYERVHRVLRRYDEHLTEAERAFLALFSAFRTPVEETAFDRVFRADMGADALNAPVATLDDAAFEALVERLVTYRILRHDPRGGTYTAHPLIRNHYLAHLTAGERGQAHDAHARIKDYYLELAGDTPHNPTLDDLAPLIEVVHHACHGGAYDEAHRIRRDRIYEGNRKVLTWQLGAYETALALMQEFFLGGDTLQEPQMRDPGDKSWILNEVGLCLMNLGRLGEAVPFYGRGNEIKLNITKDWFNASMGYQNLAELHAHLGALDASAEAAREAQALARRAEDKLYECYSLAYQGWTAGLGGDLETAGAAFEQAEALQREVDSTKRYLYSLRGIRHADHLRRAGDPSTGSGRAADYARRVTEANLEVCERNRWLDDLSRSHRVLGDLDADAGQHDTARAHYDEALKIARGITFRPVLIGALLARGRWAARQQRDSGTAFSDLNEALGYAVDGGYRVYEADVRVALAWAHLAAGDKQAARAEAERAQQMSEQMGYHWGQVDSAEVLGAVGLNH